MKYNISVYNIWEFGQRKDAQGNPHQEDSMYPAFGKATPADRLFILCDGMGGHDAGEVASQTVCDVMSASILAACPDPEGPFTADEVRTAIERAYDALDSKDTGASKKMGTTMTMLKLYNEGAMIAHMGDSRVYHIRPGKDGASTRILHKTRDHSLVNDLIAIGELTEEEARTSNKRNVITRAMMPHLERRYKADIYSTSDILPGDYFYMCSDGMLEVMEDIHICNIFSAEGGDDAEKVRILTAATAENHDNHTAFIIRIDAVDGKPAAAPQPAAPKPQTQQQINRIPTFVPRPLKRTNTERRQTMVLDAPVFVPEPPEGKSGNKWLWLIVGAAVVVIAVVAALLLTGGEEKKSSKKAPEDKIENVIDDVQQGKPGKQGKQDVQDAINDGA